VQNFLALPFLLAGTNRVAILQQRLADKLGAFGGIRVLELPLAVPELIEGKYSEFPSVDGRLDDRRCWSTAVGVAGQATRADSLGGSVPAVSGWRVQAARSSGLSAQGRNRSRAAPVGGLPPASAQACR